MLNIALVDVGAGTSDISITRDGSIIAYGMIPYAGDELTEAIVHHYLVDFKTAEQMKRDSLRTYSAAFSTICTSSCYMECTDNMKHLLFERVHICFLRTVEFVAVEYTFTAAACRTDITAGIAADTFA